jgi:hypothetical protein
LLPGRSLFLLSRSILLPSRSLLLLRHMHSSPLRTNCLAPLYTRSSFLFFMFLYGVLFTLQTLTTNDTHTHTHTHTHFTNTYHLARTCTACLLLIKTTNQEIFGFYSTQWPRPPTAESASNKGETQRNLGNGESFAFSLTPGFSLYYSVKRDLLKC